MSTDLPTPPPTEGLLALKAHLALHLQALEAYLLAQKVAFEPEIHPYLTHCLSSHGKRLRATLLLLAGWEGPTILNPELVKAAAIMELIHHATLVHDDVLDGAELRQGHPTLSALHGPIVAVLLGDALFAHALTLASEYPTPMVCRIVATATRQVCTGEIAQTFHRDGEAISRNAYERIIDLKTAALFAASTELGALIAGHSTAFVQAAKAFGQHLGIAYQIYDDAADYLANEAAIGKTLGTDLLSGKITLPFLLLLEALPSEKGEALLGQIKARTLSLEAVRQLFSAHKIPAQLHARFTQTMAEARSLLAPFTPLKATEKLLQAAAQIQDLWRRAGLSTL